MTRVSKNRDWFKSTRLQGMTNPRHECKVCILESHFSQSNLKNSLVYIQESVKYPSYYDPSIKCLCRNSASQFSKLCTSTNHASCTNVLALMIFKTKFESYFIVMQDWYQLHTSALVSRFSHTLYMY